jgi:hypothetical protein
LPRQFEKNFLENVLGGNVFCLIRRTANLQILLPIGCIELAAIILRIVVPLKQQSLTFLKEDSDYLRINYEETPLVEISGAATKAHPVVAFLFALAGLLDFGTALADAHRSFLVVFKTGASFLRA